MHDGYAYFTTDDGKFYIDASVDGILKRTLINPTDDATGKVKSATVAEWAQQTSLTSEKDVIYVYTDHQTDDGKNIPGIKIGDGLTHVVDLPFVDTIYMKHITDTDIHITAEERAKWNKVNSAVPNTRTVNGKALSSDISLGAGDVGAYTKSETDTKINAAIASAYKYKGSVTADKLPTSGQVVGDVYNITNDSSYGKAGMNVAWNGTTWDALGSNVDLSNYVTTSDSRLSNARPASDVYAWAKAASKPSYSASEIGAAPASHTHTKDQVGLGNVANLDQSKAIKSITRSGTTFTATALDGTTSTFTQQDINTTQGLASSSSNGLMSASDKSKLDGIGAGSNVKSVNGKTGAVTLAKSDVGLSNVDNTADNAKSVKYATSAGNANTATGHSLGLNIPSPSVEDQDKFLSGKGVWESITGKIEGTKVTAADTADKLATARNITVGSSSKKFDGSSDVSYSLSEIGAAPASHNHDDRYEIAYRSNFASHGAYIRLGIATMRQQGDYLFIRVYSGSSYNGLITNDRAFDIHLRTSNGSGPLYAGYVEYHLNGSSNNDVYIVPNSSGTTYAIWIGLTCFPGNGFYIVEESNGAGWSNSQTTSNSIPSGAIKLTQKNIAYTSDIPTSLPANGGNSSTVNGHTVNADVPSGAKFTDTTYSAATQSANGLMSAADKKAIDREFFRLLPKGGTYIPPNADLNTIQYLKVGNYYNPSVAESEKIKNIPISTYNAFIMYVLSPLSEVYDNESTAQWVYRLRIFIAYTGNDIFVQKVVSGATPGSFTYGPWVKMTNSNDLGAVSNTINDHIANKSNPHGVTKAQVGLGNVDNTADKNKSVKYANSAGSVAWGNISGRPSSEGVKLTIPVSGWSSKTTAVNGTNYYTYSTTSITGISNPHPTIICSSASGVLPSAEERMAFDNIQFVTVNTSSSKITFYAPTKPKSTVVLIVLHHQT